MFASRLLSSSVPQRYIARLLYPVASLDIVHAIGIPAVEGFTLSRVVRDVLAAVAANVVFLELAYAQDDLVACGLQSLLPLTLQLP